MPRLLRGRLRGDDALDLGHRVHDLRGDRYASAQLMHIAQALLCSGNASVGVASSRVLRVSCVSVCVACLNGWPPHPLGRPERARVTDGLPLRAAARLLRGRDEARAGEAGHNGRSGGRHGRGTNQQASKHLAARAAPLGLHREARGGRGAQRGDRGHEGRAAGHEGEEDSDDLQRKASLNQQLCLTDESTPTDESPPRWLRAECTRRQAAGPCDPALFFSGCLSAVNYYRPSTLSPPLYYTYINAFLNSTRRQRGPLTLKRPTDTDAHCQLAYTTRGIMLRGQLHDSAWGLRDTGRRFA